MAFALQACHQVDDTLGAKAILCPLSFYFLASVDLESVDVTSRRLSEDEYFDTPIW